MTTPTTTEPTFYDSMYAYVKDADISHYHMTGDGEDEYMIAAFNPADDPEFIIDNARTIEHNGKTYIPVCWGENEPSALLESEIDTAQCYILYNWNVLTQGYISDGIVYDTRDAAEIVAIVANLTDTQYYCEKCAQVFEYSYPEQHGCEQCNTSIQDNNVAEVRT